MEYVLTVKALTEKRAEFSDELLRLQTAVGVTIEKLRIIDATLEIFGIERDVQKSVRQRFRGENARTVLTVLREAKSALTSEEISRQVMLRRQMDIEDVVLARAMLHRVRGILQHYRRKRALAARENNDSRLEWSIA